MHESPKTPHIIDRESSVPQEASLDTGAFEKNGVYEPVRWSVVEGVYNQTQKEMVQLHDVLVQGWEHDRCALLDALTGAQVPQADADRILAEYDTKRDEALANAAHDHRVSLDALHELLQRSKLTYLASVLAISSELNGCATMQSIDRWTDSVTGSMAIEQVRHNPEEWRFLSEDVRHDAQVLDHERGYIYSVGTDGEFHIASRAQSEGGKRSVSFSGGAEINGAVADSIETYMVHTHPRKAMEGITTEVFEESLSPEKDEAIVEAQWQAIPPSLTDVFQGLFDMVQDVRQEGRQRNMRVVDSNGVWTFSADFSHPYLREGVRSHMAVFPQIASLLESNGIDFDHTQMQYPIYCLELLARIRDEHPEVADSLANMILVQAAGTSFDEEKSIEYAHRQLAIAIPPPASKEEMLSRVQEFILWAETKGIQATYEPFDAE